MKLFYDKNFTLVKEQDVIAFQGDQEHDVLYVYLDRTFYNSLNTEGTTIFPKYSAKLPNGRMIGDYSIPQSIADAVLNGVNYVGWKVTITDNVFKLKGIVQMTISFYMSNTTSTRVAKTGLVMLNVLESVITDNGAIYVGERDGEEILLRYEEMLNAMNVALQNKANLNGNASEDFECMDLAVEGLLDSAETRTTTIEVVDSADIKNLDLEAFTSNVLPNTTESLNIGSNAKKWNYVFAKNVKSDFVNANGLRADKLCDIQGNELMEMHQSYSGLIRPLLPTTNNATLGSADYKYPSAYIKNANIDELYATKIAKTIVPKDYNVFLGSEESRFTQGWFTTLKANYTNFSELVSRTSTALGGETQIFGEFSIEMLSSDIIPQSGRDLTLGANNSKFYEAFVKYGKFEDLKVNGYDVATQSYVNTAIQNLLGIGTPAQFDTLKEIADYLSSHASDYSALVTTVNAKANSSDVYTKDAIDSMKMTTATLNTIGGMFDYE